MTAPTTAQAIRAGRVLVAGVLLGLGTVAFIDETVFHQLLHWHHFYDRATPDVGLVSDGLFHAFSWFAAPRGRGQSEPGDQQAARDHVPGQVVRDEIDVVADLVQPEHLVLHETV